MDPDAALEEMLKISKRILEREEAFANLANDDVVGVTRHVAGTMNDGKRLAELVQALDQWISRDGFLPSNWQEHTEQK